MISHNTKNSNEGVNMRRFIEPPNPNDYLLERILSLSKFFDTVNHDVLMHRVARKIKDKRVLKLIGKYLRAGVVINGRRQVTRKGVPQGGPLSL